MHLVIKMNFEQLICSNCKLFLSVPPITYSNGFVCGRCSDSNGAQRLLCYEKIAREFKFNCRYAKNGCGIRLKFEAIGKHENICDNRDFPCVFCNETIIECNMQNHLHKYHSDQISNYSALDIPIEATQTVIYKLFIERNQLFIGKINIDDCGLKISFYYFGKNFDHTYTKYLVKLHSDDFSKHLSFSNKTVKRFSDSKVQISLDLPMLSDFTNAIVWLEVIFAPEFKMLMKLQDDYMKLLQCIVCSEYMIEIGQCNTGHSFCKTCIDKMNECPICRNIFTKSTNYLGQNLGKMLQYPCRNYGYGCFQMLPPSRLDEHFKNCYVCPLSPSCNMVGNLKDVIDHCKNHHVVTYDKVEKGVCDLKKQRITRLFCTDGNIFKYHRECSKTCLNWTMMYIGPPKDARLYEYSVKLIVKNRSWEFTEACSSYTKKICYQTYFSLPLIILQPYLDLEEINCSISIVKKKTNILK